MSAPNLSRRRTLALLAGSLAVGGCGHTDEVTLGFLAPLSGRRSDLGEGGRNGALVAVETLNSQGGVAGRPLRLLVEDDQMSAEPALAGFRRMLANGVVGLVGAYSKPVGDAVVPVAHAAAVPVISPNLSQHDGAGHGAVLLRLNRTAQQNAHAYARHLTQAGQRRIAVIAELSSRDFVLSWLKHFRLAMTEMNGETSHVVTYTADAGTSFDALVQTALGPACDGAVLIGPTVDVARLCQQCRRRSPELPLATIDRAGNAALLQLGGRAVEDLVMLQAFDPEGRTPAFVAFGQRYQDRFGEQPGQSAVLAYDAIAVLQQALLRRSGSRSLVVALSQGGPFQGLQQAIAFDDTGRAQRQAHFVKIRNGRFTTLGAA